MSYRIELDIAKPHAQVVKAFLDPNSLQHWQPDFVSYETLTGQGKRHKGDTAKMVHMMGKKEMVTIETITLYDPPNRYAAVYDTDGFLNIMSNEFIPVSDTQTRWILNGECKVSGIMMRLVALVMPGAFRKQTELYMKMFRDFVETADLS